MFDRIRQSDYLKNITTLTSGTVVAQAIPILISPILSRLFTPEEFGLFAFYMSIVGLCALMASLRYELAILFPKKDEDAFQVFGLAMLVDLMFSVFLLVLIILLQWIVFPRLPMDEILKTWFYFLPLLVFLISSGNVFQNWFNRGKQYKLLAVAKIVNSIGNNGIILFLGLIGTGVWGLLIGNFAGIILFNLLFIYWVYFYDKSFKGKFKKADILASARKFRDLPLANTPQAVIESFQLNGIIYLLKMFFSATVIGWYSFAIRALQAPMWILGTSVAQVFYKEASVSLQKEGNIYSSVIKTIKFTALAALPVLIIMMFFGPRLFGFVYGQSWRDAGIYAQILAPWIYFDFIRYAIAQAPILVNRLKTMLIFSIIGSGIMIGALIIGGLVFKDIKMAFIMLSAGMVIYDIGIVGWIIRITKK